jgi:hypothetical protein
MSRNANNLPIQARIPKALAGTLFLLDRGIRDRFLALAWWDCAVWPGSRAIRTVPSRETIGIRV